MATQYQQVVAMRRISLILNSFSKFQANLAGRDPERGRG